MSTMHRPHAGAFVIEGAFGWRSMSVHDYAWEAQPVPWLNLRVVRYHADEFDWRISLPGGHVLDHCPGAHRVASREEAQRIAEARARVLLGDALAGVPTTEAGQ